MSRRNYTTNADGKTACVQKPQRLLPPRTLHFHTKDPTAHAASLGWSFDALRSAGRVWVVRQHWIEYLRSARLGDELVVATWVESVRRLSSLRRYAVLRNGELLTVGATEWVLVDYERRTPVQIPEEMRASFRLVAPDAEVLRDMGIRRMVRFAPSPGLAAASK